MYKSENEMFVIFQLADPPPQTNSIYSEELVNHLNEQIRVQVLSNLCHRYLNVEVEYFDNLAKQNDKFALCH